MNKLILFNLRRTMCALVVFPLILAAQPTGNRPTAPDLLRQQWSGSWVEMPSTAPQAYGVYLFRKSFETADVPASFPVYVSADNRYKLYVNGRLVSLGPARCDVEHWNYETVDLAPYLKSGRNIVAAKVWNEGDQRAEAQTTFRTGFIMQGVSPVATVLNTDTSWRCTQDESYSIPRSRGSFGYSVVSPNEMVNMRTHIRGWETANFNDKAWKKARPISRGTPKNTIGIDANKTWRLVASTLPQMELTPQRLREVRQADGVKVPAEFPAKPAAIRIPPRTRAVILLDNGVLTNAYTTLRISGGARNDSVYLTYGESLYEGFRKGNRNQVEGKRMMGRTDVVISDGSNGQEVTSLTYRTYRYVQIRVQTHDRPLVIDDFYGTFTGYPFVQKAQLQSTDAELQKILEIGWRTARLCAVETYMDCPFYEQLQYIGDTRIQALVSLYNSGDDRLMKSMLTHIDNSRHPEGITLSRYPTVNPQMIPTFTLWYICMLHDYMMYGGDTDFIRGKLAGERLIMNYFRSFQAMDGSLKNLPNWAYVDWAMGPGWQRGMSPKGQDGSSAIQDLQLLLAYQAAKALEQNYGMAAYALQYQQAADMLRFSIRRKYWDAAKRLYADTPEKNAYSQHANALAILAGLLTGDEAKQVARSILTDTSLTQASIYFKFYVHQALTKAGLGDEYLSWLDIWRQNIALGLTTWGETSQVESTRSDCHAWGSSPNIEVYRILLGIDSDAPGFKSVRMTPHLGKISDIGGEMPHPQGKITVQYHRTSTQLQAQINLPAGVKGTLVWSGKTYPLQPGANSLTCETLADTTPARLTEIPDTPPADVTANLDFRRMLQDMHLELPKLTPRADDPNRPSGTTPQNANNLEGRWMYNGHDLNRSLWGLWDNYDDTKDGFFPGRDAWRVGKYTPIDLLKMHNGKKIKSAKDWWEKRRPEIAYDVQNALFGFMPPKEQWPAVIFQVEPTEGDSPSGRYIQKTLTGQIDISAYPQVRNIPYISATLRTPADAKGPVPVMIVFGGWGNVIDHYWNLLAPQGWGLCVFSPNTVQPDNGAGLTSYLIGLMNHGQWRKPSDWGAIGAWAWGIGRLIDYLQTDPTVNAKAIGLTGHSRYGKATLFAMAFDSRIAIGFPSDSGSLGTKMNRRHWGQDLENSAQAGEYHWMAGNFMQWAGELTPGQYLPRKLELMPVDAHSILALCAPRPVFINGGDDSQWSDPYGMYLTGKEATPVYELLGVKGLVMPDKKPVLDKAYIGGTIGFRYHDGGHTDLPDWPAFFEFAKKFIP